MCLVAFAIDAHPRHRLVLAGNRDEAFARPAAALAAWPDAPHVVAGRDLGAGGTWLGASRDGRWAVLTNVRDPLHPRPSARSRGALVAEYLSGADAPDRYAQAIQAERDQYDGFNLVVGRGARAFVVSTRHDEIRDLGPGVYGLSNDQLDTPWPKVVAVRRRLRSALAQDPVHSETLFPVLDDRTVARDADLPDTGVGAELERVLSPLRIVSPGYGTRVSTVLVTASGGPTRLSERTWRPDGSEGPTVTVELGG